MRARDMDEVGAGDVEVGQRWWEAVTHANDRAVWVVTGVGRDAATLQGSDGSERAVDFGALLSRWVLLVDEAA